MNPHFENLTVEEYEQLKEAVFNVTMLIAGADGHIDPKEKEWAERIANIRTYSGPEILREYYMEVGEDFNKHLEKDIEALPKDIEARNVLLATAIRDLNPILAKLPQMLGATVYESLTSLAKHVARASGGFMRMWSISSEEANWVDLPMLTKIDFPEIEE